MIFLRHSDVRVLPDFREKTVIAVRAPTGTTLEARSAGSVVGVAYARARPTKTLTARSPRSSSRVLCRSTASCRIALRRAFAERGNLGGRVAVARAPLCASRAAPDSRRRARAAPAGARPRRAV